ncbi:glycogen synthase GlgA [Geobacter sp. AOG1]|uniref:glycogen synthase GlgA n=1 Tax=Geobacter sp. AOG1 TaxID=1566346 RepID=UPI001CC7B991|nr:glycogen synthase GlgA [Geobacter sp. AOG1]GFE57453.1 glycogen synthase 2 [Geobacter sp. AOG1]
MKILFVASEVAPFAKTGGLADVTGSLPVALKRLGHDVRIILPLYKTVGEGPFPIHKGRKSVEIPLGETLRKGFLRQSTSADIPVYLLENRFFFHRDHLYGTPAGDYPDNHQRFAFFCRGVLDLLKRMDFRPDILHCHDWQTALVPVLLRYAHREDPFFMSTATLFTIHNLAYQGLFPKTSLGEMGFDWSYFTIDRLEYYDQVNLMKGGILTADLVTTVSPSYCNEILSVEQGCGLEGVLAQRRDDLYGVLNGLDPEEWDPATDRHIFKTYTPAAPAGKAVNKRGLQKRLGLEVAPDIPLVGMVTRLASQKGIDLLTAILPRLEGDENVQLVLLGAGDEAYHQLFEDFNARGVGNISLNIGYDSVCARQIYAGSDIFLMPSHYEPCGLGQLIALRYGAVPVVRKTGGLADTVFDGRDGSREPNGFTFDDFTADALWEALQRALQSYRQRDAWKKLVRRGMSRDYSWQQSAGEYERLYRVALGKKRL